MIRRPSGFSRPGMTFLETVMATAMLGVAASSILGTMGFVTKMQQRHEQRLGAAELAHRLTLQFLDDEDSMPTQNTVLPYPPNRSRPYHFRWRLDKDLIEVSEHARPGSNDRRQNRAAVASFKERMEVVTVRVWLSEKSGGLSRPAPGIPSATITRILDRLNFARNPDSFDNMINTDQGRQRLIEQMLGTAPLPSDAGGR